MPKNNFASIESIINVAKKGGMFILVDDEKRENEGDLNYLNIKFKCKKYKFYGKVWSWFNLFSARLYSGKKIKFNFNVMQIINLETKLHLLYLLKQKRELQLEFQLKIERKQSVLHQKKMLRKVTLFHLAMYFQ